MQEDILTSENGTIHRKYRHGLFTLFVPEKLRVKEILLETVDGNCYVRINADGVTELLAKKIAVL